ncbi:hypothetical protein L207DRAFT_490283 [Hyaloscypha variabilis F]|uniref:Cupin 2 conserved barrel domain-containing protein n=1 Tax=Hyaloscypha variabilis (strain UAMH 11265 / GT02V1 / F) TaxID=1149755 RepID=A0A2J6RJF6_HYAVF|nr:hypothetical protein L207DRAFT_490283 [Hyaloscypha variabilis F]
MATTPQFPPVIRYITANDSAGTSSFLKNDDPPRAQPTGPKSQMSAIFSTLPSFSIAKNTDLTHHEKTPRAGFPAAGASAFVVLDIGPNLDGVDGKLHKTQTLDYCIIVEGELELSLWGGKGEDGEENVERRVIKKGEVVVQRACWHAWLNLSKTEGARMVAVAIGSEGALEGGIEFF